MTKTYIELNTMEPANYKVRKKSENRRIVDSEMKKNQNDKLKKGRLQCQGQMVLQGGHNNGKGI